MTASEIMPKNLVRRMILREESSQKALEEFYLSKQEESRIKKYPEWDQPRVTPAFLLTKAYQELADTENELRGKKAQEKIRRQEMDEKWNDIRQDELLLRESFIKFNKFVKGNVEKRKRAEVKIQEERDNQKSLKEEIESLAKRLERTREVREMMKASVKECKIYQNYLEKVVTEMDDFQTIHDIFNRYETLIDARLVLADRQDTLLETIETLSKEMYQITEAKSQMLMGLNNKLAELQLQHDKAKERLFKWEGTVSSNKSLIADRNLELIRVKTCCWNIYQQMCKRKGVPAKINRDDVEQQLIFIKQTIRDLIRVAKFVEERIQQRNDENYRVQTKSTFP